MSEIQSRNITVEEIEQRLNRKIGPPHLVELAILFSEIENLIYLDHFVSAREKAIFGQMTIVEYLKGK